VSKTLLSTAAQQRAGFAALAIAALFCAGVSHAEEGGSGHYLPGSMSSFMDGVAPKETFLARANIISYKSSVGPAVKLPIAGQTTLGAEADLFAAGLSLFWRPPVEIGEGWSYAMSATLPMLSLGVTATAEAKGVGISRSSDVTAMGDMVLMPLMLNYTVDPDININFRIGAYAPTGSYEVGRLANTGKNYWSIEPTLGFMYFGQKNGREVSLFVGTTFNQENKATQYKSGTQFHLDGTLAQHFPLWGGLAGAGLSGYYYKQITDDSGAGATLGAFRAKTVGYGPVVSFITKAGGHDLLIEGKWLHEATVQNRLKGDILWLKVAMKF
jgi:hypothetical protein